MVQENLALIWSKALESLAAEIKQPGFEAWLRNTRPLALHDDTLVVGVPNEFTRDWLEQRYGLIMRRLVGESLGQDVFLKFVIPQVMEEPATGDEPPEEPLVPTNGRATGQALNPRYTFQTFVVGSANRFVHAASMAVAGAPARAYNPFFIYGGVGLGKTHLMQALAHHVLQHHPAMKVCYVSSETFTNELIKSIRDQTTQEFRSRFRGIDVLLVDDIQFLSGKEGTQEEFFHTFNTLHEASRQIVVSSDRPPKEITALEERLRSRFEWGLIADIQPPDLETRVAILRKKALYEKIRIPNEVMLDIASKIETNIRELEGALNRVVAFASLTGQPVTVELSHQVLKDLLPVLRRRPISIALIQQQVASHFNLRPEDMKAKRKTRDIAVPRQIAMYLARELTDYSLPRLGEEFGGRDHTTILHACDKIGRQVTSDPGVAALVHSLMERIRTS
jgi:chromosomal replication initiator protein